MSCNQTSYPHGTIPANRAYTFAETAESECSTFCKIYQLTPGEPAIPTDVLLDQCLKIINGGTPEVEEYLGETNLPIGFDYVEAGMVCTPCSIGCEDYDITGYCWWQVEIEHCCLDGQYFGPGDISGPC